MHKSYDIFISYRHSGSGTSDPDAVPDLKKALEEQGFKVFLDQTEISEFSSITKRVEESLANSKALLVYLSPDYFSSRACQIEFTAAFIASFKNGGKPEDRIFIINPSGKTDYLKKLPVELNDAKFAMSPEQALSVLPEKLKSLSVSFKDLGLVARPRVYGAPALNGYSRFSGRIEEMWKIHSGLNASECSMVTGHVNSDTVILRGLGGIGKSLLAEEYAIRFGSAYPGGIYWLKAYGSYNPENPDIDGFKTACKNEFIKIAQTSGITPAPDTSIEQLRSLIQQIIEKRAQKCLWVVDDIPQGLSEYIDDIKNWFGPHPLSKTLVTTRSREYSNIGKECLIDVLDKDSALEILYKHGVDIERKKSDAEKLVEDILGFHALAVDISGAAIMNSGYAVKKYIEVIQRKERILLNMPKSLSDALPNGHERSIVNTIAKSINMLSEDEGGLDFLRLAANVSPAVISNKLIERVFDLITVDGVNHEITAAPSCSMFSLAAPDGEGWSVHALISATVKFVGYADDESGKIIKAAAIEALAELIKHDLNHEETMELLAEVEHARILTKTINSQGKLALLNTVSLFDLFRGNSELARQGWTRITCYNESNFGLDHPDTLASNNNLAVILRKMGDINGAKELEEHILERRKVVLGPDHPDTLTSMNNLAQTLMAIGDHNGAKKLQQYVLESRKQIQGFDHPDTLTSISNLAFTLNEMGDHKEAKELTKHVIERRKVVLGPDHPSTLTSMAILANTLRNMGDINGAKELEEHILERRKVVLGPDHPDTLSAINNLAESLRLIGDYCGAKELQQDVLERSKQIFSPDHPDTLTFMNNFALILKAVKDHNGAKELEEHVLERRKQILGPDHPDTLTSINNLASTLKAMGDNNGAKELQEHVLERRKQILGPDHPETFTSMNNLALTLKSIGDHYVARELQQFILERIKQIIGIYHPRTSCSAWNYFTSLLETGEREKAFEVLRDNLSWLLDGTQELHDVNHIKIRQMLVNLFQESP